MSQFSFGSGTLFGTRTDIANATPVQFAALQEVTIDLSYSLKELYGQYQMPLALGRGEGKFTGKAKFARIQARAYNDLFFGQTLAAGQQLLALNEAANVPAATPWTVSVANAAKFVEDLGVSYAATGLPLQLVASAPTTGQYSVAAGVYTFASADTGLGVLISYTYTDATNGQQIVINNELLGTTPIFRANFYEKFQGKTLNLQLNQCVSEKLSMQTKLTDFTIPEIDFQAFADASNTIGILSISEES